jgi:hypothetical protein
LGSKALANEFGFATVCRTAPKKEKEEAHIVLAFALKKYLHLQPRD